MKSESNDTPHKVSAIILAGGKSSRLGRDKALVKIYNSYPIIYSIVEKLQIISDDVIIVSGGKKYTNLGVKLIGDIYINNGPLAGLHSGLLAAKYSHAIVVACDMPFLNVKLLKYMASQPLDYDALVPKIEGWLEPLHSLYSRHCIDPIERLLKAHCNKMHDLLKTVAIEYVPQSVIELFDPRYLSFFNLNSPEMLKQAVDIVRK
ncbi:MAG: molybdenum cofactor guanylyltransferase [Dehalococcoidia bacterium]|nr:MAG: molybdenum cofactor guanylyltransferase [Dehalococcoidia bacterium]